MFPFNSFVFFFSMGKSQIVPCFRFRSIPISVLIVMMINCDSNFRFNNNDFVRVYLFFIVLLRDYFFIIMFHDVYGKLVPNHYFPFRRFRDESVPNFPF